MGVSARRVCLQLVILRWSRAPFERIYIHHGETGVLGWLLDYTKEGFTTPTGFGDEFTYPAIHGSVVAGVLVNIESRHDNGRVLPAVRDHRKWMIVVIEV